MSKVIWMRFQIGDGEETTEARLSFDADHFRNPETKKMIAEMEARDLVEAVLPEFWLRREERV